MPSQYGEDAIIADFFKQDDVGHVVELGAADGKDNSNSYELICQGWSATLIEPDPEQYQELITRYKDNGQVDCINMAAGTEEGEAVFYSCRQVSTLTPEFRDSSIETYGVEYTEKVVMVRTLTNILFSVGCPNIDFLSIDCEGRDIDVLASIDLKIFKPRLICMEMPTSIEGYTEYTRTVGNTFYVAK